MLQALRDKTSGTLTKIVLGGLIFVFSFFGIQSYFVARSDTWVAKVGDREISPEDFRQRFENYRQRMMQMSNGSLDGAYFEKPEIKRQVLNSLVDEQLLLGANDKLGIVVTDQRVRDEILDIPQFKTDGKFDKGLYNAVLSGQAMSPVTFQERVRHDLSVRELPNQIMASAIVSDADIDAYLKLRDQTRDFTYLTVPKPAADDYKPADEEVEKYYKEHGAEFTVPEQVSLEYIELDGSKLKVDPGTDEAALKERYEKEKERFQTKEQRQTSHILIKVAKNADADAQKAALAKAQDVEKQARAGKDFAALAKQYSDDLGSKAQGGDLGWLEKGVTDAAFETALFAMKKGDISEPVLSDEGYHIIQLRDLHAERVRSFDEVKPELAKQAAETARDTAFAEVASKLYEATYADPTSLAPAAKQLDLPVQKTELFARQGGPGIASNPGVLKAAFSDTVLAQGNNSDPIDVGTNHKVVIRIAEHKAASPKPIDQVRDDVRARLVAQHGNAQARKHADELKARFDKGETLDALATELKLKTAQAKGTGRSAANLDTGMVAAVFKLAHPEKDKPSRGLVPQAGDVYSLVQLDAVTPGDVTKADKAARDQVRDQLARGYSSEAARAFVETLRKSTKVEIAEDRMQ